MIRIVIQGKIQKRRQPARPHQNELTIVGGYTHSVGKGCKIMFNLRTKSVLRIHPKGQQRLRIDHLKIERTKRCLSTHNIHLHRKKNGEKTHKKPTTMSKIKNPPTSPIDIFAAVFRSHHQRTQKEQEIR